MASRIPTTLGGAARSVRQRSAPKTGATIEAAKREDELTPRTTHGRHSRPPKRTIAIERTYTAKIADVWALWTTKEGFESWWGPKGFRVEVHTLEARLGGALLYDMIADAPEQIEAMRRMGQPVSHKTRGTFTELTLHERLAITHIIDFVPNVEPFESVIAVEFFVSGSDVRMAVTLHPLPTEELTRRSIEGLTSQLTKLDRLFGSTVQ